MRGFFKMISDAL